MPSPTRSEDENGRDFDKARKDRSTTDASPPAGKAENQSADAGRLGDYRIVREIGRGGMGVVYEAGQESLGRRVAIKILPLSARANPSLLRRFEIEARSAARLQHAHIVPVHGLFHHGDITFYVMRYIDGRGLDAVLREVVELRRNLPDARVGIGRVLDSRESSSLPEGRVAGAPGSTAARSEELRDFAEPRSHPRERSSVRRRAGRRSANSAPEDYRLAARLVL